MQLPFADGLFDVLVCQFGAMFFSDKAKAYSEARRVLRPGGQFIFNVWDQIQENEFADVVTNSLKVLFPSDPPQFLTRIPHGYHDPASIAQDLVHGGFAGTPEILTVPARSLADSPRTPALAYCQGTPLRSEIEARTASRLAEATDAATNALTSRFGSGPIDGKIQALIIDIQR
jgi:SAM-dependent methyltransferase